MANVSAIQREACELAIRRVRFESARVGFTPEAVARMAGRANRNGIPDDTAEVREATRLFMETWVVPILEALRDGDTLALEELI